MSDGSALKRTVFYDFHVKHHARMVDFAGWEMPLLYKGITAEHEQTRAGASIFDVSHMGRLRIAGRNHEAFLNRILTRNIAAANVGQSLYSLVCNENGGILDDVIASKFDGNFLIVCNASNREKLLAHFRGQQLPANESVTIDDETFKTAMVALQGPRAIELLNSVLPESIESLKRYHFVTQRYMMFVQYTIFRSGYTGEDGVEIILGNSAAQMALSTLFSRDVDQANAPIQPAGLGARDTLRLEAGMPLYGHELTEDIDPISAGLQWAVDPQKEFVGAAALRRMIRDGPAKKLVGLVLDSPRQARQGMNVLEGDKITGAVTSGGLTPTIKKSIAMAYVDSSLATPGKALGVDLRGSRVDAVVTALPFYKRRG